MAVDKYNDARKLLLEGNHRLLVDPLHPVPPELVSRAERTLGVVFPISYRRFLEDFGTGGFGSLEILGITGDDFEISGFPDGIWYTMRQRQDINLDVKYLIVEHGGDGTCVAIDTNQRDSSGECSLVRLSLDGKPIEVVSDSFGSWLLEELNWRMRLE